MPGKFNEPAPQEDLSSVLAGLVPSAPAVDAAASTPPQALEGGASHYDMPQSQRPSIANYATALRQTSEGAPKPPYSEALGHSIDNAISPESLLQSHFRDLHKKTPEERADIGSKFGGGLGLATNGMTGALLGAGFGAMAARAMGKIQTGEHENELRRGRVFETFNTLNLASPEGLLKWEDGGDFFLTNNPSARLANTDSTVSGKKDRALYEIDSSHPMARRTMAVARPLAYVMTHGFMNWRNPKNKNDAAALDQTTGIIVNALQHKAKDIGTVYNRAAEMVKKFGMNEVNMRMFFDELKNSVDDREAGTIRQGLDALFPSQPGK